MHSSTVNNMFYRAFKLSYRLAAILLFLTGSFAAKAQSNKYTFAPADSGFVMEISRQKSEVIISITFNDSLVFDYVSIERRADFNLEFSQCKYITYDEVKTKGRHIVKKDIYAYSGANDVSYRVKLGTKEGALRIYPPITLPSVKK